MFSASSLIFIYPTASDEGRPWRVKCNLTSDNRLARLMTSPSILRRAVCAVIAHMRGAVTLQLLLMLHSLGSTAHVRLH